MRFFFAFVLSLFVCIGLFIGMHFMISSDNKTVKKDEQTRHLVYLREKKELNVERKKRVKPKRKIEKPPTKKIKIQKVKLNTKVNQNIKITPLKVNIQKIDISATSSLSGAQIEATKQVTAPMTLVDANSLIAIKRVNPRYPRNAKRRGTEGFVQLEFVISEDGLVSNVKVLSAKPSGVFNKSAIRAIQKWKFRPSSSSKNATITFNFRIAK